MYPNDDFKLTCDQWDPHTVWSWSWSQSRPRYRSLSRSGSWLEYQRVDLVGPPGPGVCHAAGEQTDCKGTAEGKRCQVPWIRLPLVPEGTEVWVYSLLRFQHTFWAGLPAMHTVHHVTYRVRGATNTITNDITETGPQDTGSPGLYLEPGLE